MNPLAIELNTVLRGSLIDGLLSDLGKRLYFPKGIMAVIDVDASTFNTEKPSRIIGEVRYCQQVKEGKYRLGVRFVEIEKPLLAKITEYVEHNKDKAV